MPLSPVPTETYGGLNIVDDPGTIGWTAAIDALNVDLDQRGRLRSRNGSVDWSAVNSNAPRRLAAFYRTSGSAQLLLLDIDGTGHPIWRAYSDAGALVSTSAIAGITSQGGMAIRYGTPAAEEAYLSRANGAAVIKWDGTAFSTPAYTAITPSGTLLAVEHSDNRLVNARYASNTAGNNPSTVRFSDAGDPLTFGANNYVDLDPGDGESIVGLIAWRELLFAFKHSKFFVFYGTSTDGDGNPVFNERPLVGQGRDAGFLAGNDHNQAFCAAPEGVYFATQRGIWLTTGGPPTLVSAAIQPIFRGEGANPFWQGGYVNSTGGAPVVLHYHDNRLYVAYSTTGASTTDAMLVYDPRAETWMAWDVAAASMCSFLPSGATTEQLMFGRWSNKKVAYMSSTVSADAGTAITSRYRAGFSDLGSPDMKRIHSWRLQGSGSPTLKVATDFGSLETGAAVTLGTAPAVAEGVRRYAPRGRQVSWQVGATSAWSLNNLIANVAGKRKSGEHGT